MENNINKDGYRESIIDSYNDISLDFLARLHMTDNMTTEEKDALYEKMIGELSKSEKVKVLEREYNE